MGIHTLGVLLLGLALHIVGRLVWRKKAPLPPGPPGWPLIGNLFDFPRDAPYKTMGAISKKYGPIVSLNLMGTQYVVINSPKAAKDLLDKNSATTSNRPHFTMACDLVGWGDFMAFVQYGDTYRKHRRLFHQQIGTKSSLEAFHPAEEMEVKRFIRNVLKSPDDLITHCHRMTGSTILKISHGYTVKEGDDPLVEMAEKVIKNFSLVTIPGRFLVDVFPVVRYLPEWFLGGGFRADARRWKKMINETVDTPHQFVLEHLAKGDAAPSFTSRVLEEGVTPEDEMVLKWASFAMYLGGSETTPSVLSAFFLAMTMYPDTLKKAQMEVDAVIGHERLPTFEDRDALPYVNALCMELLRWHVVVTFAIHVTAQDIIYEKYLIPKGTYLLLNIWFILSDPETYPNPEAFKPERFLGENRQLDPREACFGYGRRSCPGANLAEMSIFISVAMALATLDVTKCIKDGVECTPRYDVTEGTIRSVNPFKCRIVRRSKKAEDLLRDSFE